MSYSCGVGNCGNGKCVHEPLDERCPHCGARLIKNTSNGVIFCAGNFELCGYEREPSPLGEKEKTHFEENYKGMTKAVPNIELTGGKDWNKD